MFDRIDGCRYRDMIDYGIRNLALYQSYVNDLNVFPVPDGDTGTNMLMTLRNGYGAIDNGNDDLSEVAGKFAKAVVYGARGNSGVITSQFFRGVSECFFGVSQADCRLFAAALGNGVKCAYRAVAHPVEGTILTVLREATDYVEQCLEKNDGFESVEDVVARFLERAKEALEHTPEKLAVLKDAGVVDSGAAGIIYVFEGIDKYLLGEEIRETAETEEHRYIDYSVFNRESRFEFGYCTELLLQLTDGKESFDYADFRREIGKLGESVVTSFENDKVKLHVHSFTPGKVLEYCNRFGEFLSLKIENMSVQHTEDVRGSLDVSDEKKNGKFAVVAVSTDAAMRDIFMNMGADVVLTGPASFTPSAEDFIEAFKKTKSGVIVVFPNNSKFQLAAEQAKRLYGKAEVHVVSSRSIADCYAALPLVDFETDDLSSMLTEIENAIANIYNVSVSKAVRNAVFGKETIERGNFIAMSGKKLCATGQSVTDAAIGAVKTVMDENERDVITLFSGASVKQSEIDDIVSFINDEYILTETCVIKTDSDACDLIIAFE